MLTLCSVKKKKLVSHNNKHRASLLIYILFYYNVANGYLVYLFLRPQLHVMCEPRHIQYYPNLEKNCTFNVFICRIGNRNRVFLNGMVEFYVICYCSFTPPPPLQIGMVWFNQELGFLGIVILLYYHY